MELESVFSDMVIYFLGVLTSSIAWLATYLREQKKRREELWEESLAIAHANLDQMLFMDAQLVAIINMLRASGPASQQKQSWIDDLNAALNLHVRPNSEAARTFYDSLRATKVGSLSLSQIKDVHSAALHAKRLNETANKSALVKIHSVTEAVSKGF